MSYPLNLTEVPSCACFQMLLDCSGHLFSCLQILLVFLHVIVPQMVTEYLLPVIPLVDTGDCSWQQGDISGFR